MEIIRKSTAEEATLEWLKAEMNSARFSDDLHAAVEALGYDEKLITVADMTNMQDNESRWGILKKYRNWIERDFSDYDWQIVQLDHGEVGNLKYIDYSYWNELSDGTRRVGRAAMNVAEGKIVFDVPHDRFHSVAKLVEDGTSLPPIIVVSNGDDNEGEILEGHLRATGYALARQTVKPLRAVWGMLRQYPVRSVK